MLPICWHSSSGLADGVRGQNIALGRVGFMVESMQQQFSLRKIRLLIPLSPNLSKPSPNEMLEELQCNQCSASGFCC